MSESQSWLNALHEAGHSTIAYAIGGAELMGARMHSGVCDVFYRLPPDLSDAKAATIDCLIAMAGAVAAETFGQGPVPAFERYTDFEKFSGDLKSSLLRTASPDMAARVLTPIVRKLLHANDRLVYAVANALLQKKHLYGDDLMCLLAGVRRQFGIDRGPFEGEDWQGALLSAVEAEVAALEAEAKDGHRQAPTPALRKALSRPALERKVGSGSATLWVK